jgi:hypothetical protein
MEQAHNTNGQIASAPIEDPKKDIGGLFSSLNRGCCLLRRSLLYGSYVARRLFRDAFE